MENKNTYEIKVIVGEGKTKEGKTFATFKVVQTDGKLVDCRFRKDCNIIPKETCMMIVLKENIHLDSKREFPCYWVKAIEELKPIVVSKKDLPF